MAFDPFRCDDAQVNGRSYGADAAGHVELPEYVLEMILDGMHRDVKFICDNFIGVAITDHFQNSYFLGCQPLDAGAVRPADNGVLRLEYGHGRHLAHPSAEVGLVGRLCHCRSNPW